MQIIKVNPDSPDGDHVNKVASSLSQGNVVIFPTETVYTFAADATSEAAVKNVYKLKGRDYGIPMHVVVSSIDAASKYVKVTPDAEALADKFLPGPLSVVLEKHSQKLPEILTSGLSTLGIRIPDLEICKQVSTIFGKPYTTTSANKSGGENTYTVNSVLEQLTNEDKEMIDLIVNVGELPQLAPSTLVDLTIKPYKILREGPVVKNQISEVLDLKYSR